MSPIPLPKLCGLDEVVTKFLGLLKLLPEPPLVFIRLELDGLENEALVELTVEGFP
jgi:hypothetical protein